jgi:hypothetical protein
MSCDFELIRFICSKDKTLLTQKLFGRGWNMLRVDGERGALCSMTPPSPETIEEVLRKLHRLKRWADYLRLDTWLPEVIAWARFGPYDHPFRCTT